MPRIPRALVISPVLDGKAMAEALDKTLQGFQTAKLSAQVINTATVTRDSKTWSLFTFLDTGTKPHYIGEADTVLANQQADFGPVWGPVFHPGTRPYDITARVDLYMQAAIRTRVAFPTLNFAGISSKDDNLPWNKLRTVLVGILKSTVAYAVEITPDTWQAVKAGYRLSINGKNEPL